MSDDRIDALVARVQAEGPPPGVPVSGLKVLFDEAQGTAVVIQHFDSVEDMNTAAQTLSAMDPSETPGTRASVDTCEVKLKLSAAGGA